MENYFLSADDADYRRLISTTENTEDTEKFDYLVGWLYLPKILTIKIIEKKSGGHIYAIDSADKVLFLPFLANVLSSTKIQKC